MVNFMRDFKVVLRSSQDASLAFGSIPLLARVSISVSFRVGDLDPTAGAFFVFKVQECCDVGLCLQLEAMNRVLSKRDRFGMTEEAVPSRLLDIALYVPRDRRVKRCHVWGRDHPRR